MGIFRSSSICRFSFFFALQPDTLANSISHFSYKTIKSDLFFGYEQKPWGNRAINIALPEKAILDLLYLYPFYNTEKDIEDLRFDEDFIRNDLNIGTLALYLDKFDNKRLAKRVKIFTDFFEI